MEFDVEEYAEKLAANAKGNTTYYAQKNKIRGDILKRLLQSGKIPLDNISILASELMENKCVREAVGLRLQYLFIDEFQDVEISQFHVFESIRKVNNTVIYAVGDPEQYIMGYTYRGKRKPIYSKIPINTWDADKSLKVENYRAFDELVKFTNLFHGQIKQISQCGSSEKSSVNFLENTSLDEIVKLYQKHCSKIEQQIPEEKFLFFYLSYENKTFESIAPNFGLFPLISDQQGFKTSLENAIELICSVTGKTKLRLLDCYKLDEIQLRKLGIQIIDAIHDKTVTTFEQMKKHLAGEGIELDSEINSDKDENLFNRLKLTISGKHILKNNHFFSSVHRAKGLEADGVLVVAETANQLKKWLITNPDERHTDESDMCRIGYVAFTRAKLLLYIACLQKIDTETKLKLKNMGVCIQSNDDREEIKQLLLL
jgi:DNA helicase-2/ATP-dependent DNA helicase PcrA